MKVNYKKLWILLAHREMSKADLRKMAGIAPAPFTKLRRNQEVALSVLLKIADVLNCDVGDMVSFIKDGELDPIEESKELTWKYPLSFKGNIGFNVN